MRKLLLISALSALGCAPDDDVKMNIDSKVGIGGGSCVYYPSESVQLEFKQASLDGKKYEVMFVVKESTGKEFKDYALLSKECRDDFEKRGTIPGILKRIKTGVCNPASVFPEKFDINCWTPR